jgi:hypothetical protein
MVGIGGTGDSAMFNAMTSRTEPNYIERGIVSSVMMAVWFAFLQTFRALIRTHYQSFSDGIEKSLASLSLLWIVNWFIPVNFTRLFWVLKSPFSGAFSQIIGMIDVIAVLISLRILCVLFEFFRVFATPLYLPLAAFFSVFGAPFPEVFSF